MSIKNLATHIPEKLTVYEFLTELNDKQLKELEEMISEVRESRIEIAQMEMPIHERAFFVANKMGWKLLKTTNLKHPDDSHLIYTVIERENKYAPNGKDYATHLFNGSFNEFAYGHYDFETLEDAVKDMKERAK